MSIPCAPEQETIASPAETRPERKRGGWTLNPEPRVGLDLGSDDDLLLLENKTMLPWKVYHNYHHLGIIDPGELLVFHLCKHGSLSVHPQKIDNESVEFLTISLHYSVNQVQIYRRTIREDLEVYDMRAL